MLDIIAQIGILFTGATSIFLVGVKGKYRRYGYLLGVIGQPFWYYTTFVHGQWFIFALSFLYTFSWVNGLRNYWNESTNVSE